MLSTSIKRTRTGACLVMLMGLLFGSGAPAGCDADSSAEGGKPVLSDLAHVAQAKDAKLATVFDDRLEFPSTSDFAGSLRDGDIVVSGYEGGFLRKVQKVETSGDKVVVRTEDASLEDVVVSGTLGTSAGPTAEGQSAPLDYHPLGTQDGSLDMSFSRDVSGMQLVKEDNLKVRVTSGTVNVQASLDLGLTYESGLQAAHAVASGQVEVDMEIEVEADLGGPIDRAVNLWTSPDVPIPLASFVACHGQLVIRGLLKINASGRVTLRMKETLQLDSRYGFFYTKDGGFEKVGDFNAQWQQGDPALGGMVDVDGKVALQGGVNVVFYPGHKIFGKLTGTKANVSLLAGPYARLEYSSSAPAPGWGLYGGVAVTATADASVLGHGFGPWKWDVYSNEQLLLPKADEAAPIDMGDCSDDKTDGTESDLDCGGGCSDCGAGAECLEDADCKTGACAGGACVPVTCQNGVMDASELGVDCGGPCLSCPGDGCTGSSECAQGNCADGICEESLSCYNEQQDESEDDIDCGGDCTPCPGGQVGLCENMELDDDEEDVDCGGLCPPCDGGGGSGAGGSGAGGSGAGGSGATGCDGEADCGACVSCADADPCSQAYADCVNIPECVCLYNCSGEQTCADQQCGDYSAGIDPFYALWGCEDCECTNTCGTTCQ
jgi:hypothetical protein